MFGITKKCKPKCPCGLFVKTMADKLDVIRSVPIGCKSKGMEMLGYPKRCKLCEKFGERKFTTTVKDLIRQCIHQNLKEMPTKRITAGVAYALFERTLEMADRNIGMQEGSEKYRQMYKDGKLALQALIEHLEKKRS